MSIIIQTDDNLRDDLDLILLLAKHKTAVNVKKFIESLDWEGYKQNKNGEQFFAIIASFIYSIFEGTDVAGNLITEIEKQKENAKIALSKIQLCDLCQFEYFHCEYEKHLYHIPFLEQANYIEDYLRKIPMIGQRTLKKFLETKTEITQYSLAYARKGRAC